MVGVGLEMAEKKGSAGTSGHSPPVPKMVTLEEFVSRTVPLIQLEKVHLHARHRMRRLQPLLDPLQLSSPKQLKRKELLSST